MKKILFFTIQIVFLLSSCGLLDEEPYSYISKENYIRDASEAEDVLLGIYSRLSDDGTYAQNLSMMFDITSDEAQAEGNSNAGDRAIPSLGFTASDSRVERTWRTLYAAIFDATDFIEIASLRIDNFDGKDKKLTECYIAEAKALRALLYFELVRWYGNIVLVTSTTDSNLPNEAYKGMQVAPEKVYQQIEKDLLEAAPALPWAIDDDLRGETSYRISRGSVYGLLTKVYATWAGYPVHDESKWKNAVEVAEMIIKSERHHLHEDYKQLWKNAGAGVWDPAEVLIGVGFYNIRSGAPAGRIGKWNGVKADLISGKRGANSAFVKVLYTFIDDWCLQNDPRFDVSIASYEYRGTEKRKYSEISVEEGYKDIKKWQLCTPAKWNTEEYVTSANLLVDPNNSNVSWYVLRYSDVLLLYAEALNEVNNGPTKEAYEAINSVRRRGFGKDIYSPDEDVDLPSGLDKEGFWKAIKDERSYELCFEGQRKQDLVRWGIYYETICNTGKRLKNISEQANYIALEYIKENKYELMPIPQREIDLLGLKQNPNW